MVSMGKSNMSAINRQPYSVAWHDFDMFMGCFGNTKIMPTDIDFIVERKGNFLIMELKTEGKQVFYGQELMLLNLSKLPKTTVVLLYHKPRSKCDKCGAIHDIPIFTSKRIYPEHTTTPTNNEDIKKFVSNWFKSAIV